MMLHPSHAHLWGFDWVGYGTPSPGKGGTLAVKDVRAEERAWSHGTVPGTPDTAATCQFGLTCTSGKACIRYCQRGQQVWLRESAETQACLLGGLQAVTDDDLPMLTSDFYAKHMLPAKPEGGCLPLAPLKGCSACAMQRLCPPCPGWALTMKS